MINPKHLDKALLSYLSSFFTETKLSIMDKVLDNRTNYLTLVIEDIYQSHNASAVIRSCDCFGIQQVNFIENRNIYQVNPKITMGATKWLTVNRYKPSWPDNATAACIQNLRAKGYSIVATSPHHADKKTPETLPLDKPVAIFFGNEKEGLSDYALQQADEHVYVPMYGFTESLNISVSAALVMKTLYERIRADQSIKWELSTEEKDTLRLNWLRKSLKKSDYIIDDFYKKHKH